MPAETPQVKAGFSYKNMKFQKGNHPRTEFRKGQISWNKGKKFSLEYRKKLSEAHKGQKMSEENIKKLRVRMLLNNPFKGKSHSEQTKIKMRKAKLKNPPRYWKGKTRPSMIGEKNKNWKGVINNSGDYKLIYLLNHPNKNGKYVPEYRLVMEKYLGRFLTKKEIVHHIDGNKKNNNIFNLCLMKDNKEHLGLHGKMDSLIFILYRGGILEFDVEKKEYYIV